MMYPLARSDEGGYPRWGTSWPGGVPPGWTWLGTPPGPGQCTPPPSNLAGVPPIWTWPGYPPRCGQTDRHVSKHNLPAVLRTRSVIMNGSLRFATGNISSTKLQRTFPSCLFLHSRGMFLIKSPEVVCFV